MPWRFFDFKKMIEIQLRNKLEHQNQVLQKRFFNYLHFVNSKVGSAVKIKKTVESAIVADKDLLRAQSGGQDQLLLQKELKEKDVEIKLLKMEHHRLISQNDYQIIQLRNELEQLLQTWFFFKLFLI